MEGGKKGGGKKGGGKERRKEEKRKRRKDRVGKTDTEILREKETESRH